MALKQSHIAFAIGLSVPVLFVAGIAAIIFFWDDLKKAAEPPKPLPGVMFAFSDDQRTAFVEATGTTVSILENWHAEPGADPAEFIMRPDNQATRCVVRIRQEKNAGGESATALLNRYDIGKRFGRRAQDQTSRIIDVGGWKAAYFEWKDADLLRYREVYVQQGAWIVVLKYTEDLNFLDRQAVPCYRDFDRLLEKGIVVP